MSDHDKISQRAYELWESEGRPEGRDIDHWVRAEAEVKVVSPSPVPAGRKAPAARDGAAKTGPAKKAAAVKKEPAAKTVAATSEKKGAAPSPDKPAAPRQRRKTLTKV